MLMEMMIIWETIWILQEEMLVMTTKITLKVNKYSNHTVVIDLPILLVASSKECYKN